MVYDDDTVGAATSSSHLEATSSSRQFQQLTDSNRRHGNWPTDANDAEQSKPSVAAAAGTSTPRGAGERKPKAAKEKRYANADTRYRTEYSQSRQRSLMASKEEPRESTDKTEGVPRSEKGIFYANNTKHYVTAEYADDDQGRSVNNANL